MSERTVTVSTRYRPANTMPVSAARMVVQAHLTDPTPGRWGCVVTRSDGSRVSGFVSGVTRRVIRVEDLESDRVTTVPWSVVDRVDIP